MPEQIPVEKRLFLPESFDIERLPAAERPARYRAVLRWCKWMIANGPKEIEKHRKEIEELNRKIQVTEDRMRKAHEKLPVVQSAFENSKNVRRNELAERIAALKAQLEEMGA